MRNCEQFRELILTEYIDGQCDAKTAEMVEVHLMDCNDCRHIFSELKSQAILPLRTVVPQAVPTELWMRIKEGIEEKSLKRNPFEEIAGHLKGWMVLPRLVPVLASFLVMFLAGSATLNTLQLQQVNTQEQGEYLASLFTPSGTSSDNESGTPIEQYFL